MKPLIFDGESVRAILAGRKTQTRRVMKPQPTHKLVDGLAHVTVGMNPADDGGVWYDTDCVNPAVREYRPPHPISSIVWVRETWCVEGLNTVRYLDGSEATKYTDHPECKRLHMKQSHYQTRSSLHMPRWAARLWLRITDVRVQRVQEISEDDAKAEGMIFTPRERVVSGMLGPADGSAPMKPYTTQPCQWSWREGATAEQSLHTARFAFANRWNAINAKPRPIYRDRQIVGYEAFPWEESHPICQQTTHRGLPLRVYPNPWVWAHTFERIEKPEGA